MTSARLTRKRYRAIAAVRKRCGQNSRELGREQWRRRLTRIGRPTPPALAMALERAGDRVSVSSVSAVCTNIFRHASASSALYMAACEIGGGVHTRLGRARLRPTATTRGGVPPVSLFLSVSFRHLSGMAAWGRFRCACYAVDDRSAQRAPYVLLLALRLGTLSRVGHPVAALHPCAPLDALGSRGPCASDYDLPG